MKSMTDLRKLDIQSLPAKIKEAREDLHKLCVAHGLEPIKNPQRIKQKRRYIARLLTLMSEAKA